MEELKNAPSGNSTPSTPNEIQMVFNSNSPFEVYSSQTYTFKVIDQENTGGSVHYRWKVANGKIIEGQGLPSVKVVFNKTYGATIAVQACNVAGNCSSAIEQYIKIHKK
jgi:hypothetical protein